MELSIITSKATGEKEMKLEVKKLWVCLAPPPKSERNEKQGHISEQHDQQVGESNVKKTLLEAGL
jgi:hypothetical protein